MDMRKIDRNTNFRRNTYRNVKKNDSSNNSQKDELKEHIEEFKEVFFKAKDPSSSNVVLKEKSNEAPEGRFQ